jgi:ABC-type transport system involved in multi-copper enzyme maturation permease subunit
MQYLQFVVLAGVLAAATLSIGLLISVLSKTRMASIAIAIVAWFLLVLVYDIGAIALALTLSASGDTLLLATLANPVEGVRILAVIGLQPDLRVLGPLGSYLVNEIGTGTTVVLLLGALGMWTAAPLVMAVRVFRGQDC